MTAKRGVEGKMHMLGASGRPGSANTRLAVDHLPLVIFFLVNFLIPAEPMTRLVGRFSSFLSEMAPSEASVIARVVCATTAFVIATVVAIVVSRLKLGRVSPMLWISGGLVIVFGGLTVYFHDPRFIQMKPTIVYATFAGALEFCLVTRRPLLERLLGSAYPNLSALGWHKLTRNWAGLFVAMAILNELVWRNASWDFWVGFKLWGAIPLTLAFAMANLPMLKRHGLRFAAS